MPIPKPRKDEEEDAFITRCMANEVMNSEYPDESQRAAICHSQFGRGKSMNNLEHKSFQVELKEEKEGAFIARIATLNVRDKDNDITLSGAFPINKTVLVSAYMHGSWQGKLPVGKATIHEQNDEVRVDGQFNLKTTEGRDTYEAIKFAPELQEWSYGFYPTEAEPGRDENEGARILKKVDVKEISPVLVGAGVNTGIIAIKNQKQGNIQALLDAWDSWAGSFTKCVEVLSAKPGISNPEALCAWLHHEAEGVWPGEKEYNEGIPYANQADAVLAAVKELVNRSQSLADLRMKEGRVLGLANRERLSSLLGALSDVAKNIDDLLKATEPVDKEKLAQARLLYMKIKMMLDD